MAKLKDINLNDLGVKNALADNFSEPFFPKMLEYPTLERHKIKETPYALNDYEEHDSEDNSITMNSKFLNHINFISE